MFWAALILLCFLLMVAVWALIHLSIWLGLMLIALLFAVLLWGG